MPHPMDCVGFGWSDLGRIVNPLSSPLSPIGQARGIYNAAKKGPGALLNPLSSPFSPFGQTRAILNVFKGPGAQNQPARPDMYYPPGYQPPMGAPGAMPPGFPPGYPPPPPPPMAGYSPLNGAQGYDWSQFAAPAEPMYDWSQFGVDTPTGWETAYGGGANPQF